MEKLMTRAAPGSYMGTNVTLLTAGSEVEVGTIYNATRAEAIVRCVDAHDALVAALERIEQAARSRETRLGDPCGLIEVRAELEAAAKQARAALALARK